MRCPKCQFENRAGARFCKKCGGSLGLRCPACGSPHESDSAFCDECGRSLTASKSPPSLDYSQPRSYTPRFLADKILTARQSIEGERKLVTVLFADVAGYTSMSEKLDPEDVQQIMDGCFQIAMDEVHRYEGTIDKFTGDGVMALFGAPVAHEDHARRACHAALALQKALEAYGDKVKRDRGFDFKMRVGLNSGPVMIGSVAGNLRMEYTAVGDTVNLASRMQTMAEPGRILVTADVHRMAREFFNFNPVGRLAVKGKEEAVEAYELLGPTEVFSRIEASAARGLTRFVGREKETADLRAAWVKARSGAGQVVGIVGEAGVGKSRLLLELRRLLEPEAYAYLEGNCLHYGSSMPLLPLLDVLRSHFGLREGEREPLVRKRLEESVSAIGPVFRAMLPPLQDLFSLKVEDDSYLDLEPQRKRERTFEAIKDILVEESRRGPLVIAIEDLHWIDRTSEEFLSYLIGHLTGSSILLVLLYRPEYTHQWASKACYSQVRVNELPSKSSADLVRAMLEEGDVAPELRELILDRAAGNPLFMEEFTHTLLEDGSILKKEQQYVLGRKASDIHVPDTIQGIIAARMDRLDENLKRIMQVASVIGRDFAYRILQTITGVQEELKSALVNLQGLEFIYEKSLYPELEYVFKHALTQEVAYNSLLLKRRKEIHGKIGQAIEELYPDRLEEFCEALAHHYSMAEDLEKAALYLRLSAEKAQRGYSAHEAFRYYCEALTALGRLPATEQNQRARVSVTLSMKTVMWALNYPEGSIDILKDGVKAAEELGERQAAVRLMAHIGDAYQMFGNGIEGLKYTQDAFEEAERLGDDDTVLMTATSLSSSYLTWGDAVRAADVAGRAIALLERTPRVSRAIVPEIDTYADLLCSLGWARTLLGDFDEAERQCQKAISRAADGSSQYSLAYARFFRSVASIYRGRPDDILYHASEGRRLCEQSQIPSFLGVCCVAEGWAYYYQGRLAAAAESSQKAIELTGEIQLPLALVPAYACSGLVSQALGDLSGARRSLEQALKVARETSQRAFEAQQVMYLGRLIIDEDQSQIVAAEQTIREGMKMAADMQLKSHEPWGHLFLGEAYAIAGQRDKALASLQKARRMCREMGMDYYLARAEKALERLEA